MLLSLLLLLLMATAAVSGDSAQSTVFTITPNKTSPDCQPPGGGCLTLEQFQEQYMSGELTISTNTTLDFMPGTHLLDSDLKVNDTDTFVMHRRQAESDASNVTINCTKPAFFDFVNITLLEINRITFLGCGSWPTDLKDNGAAIKIADVSEVWLSNITILHSRGSAIAAIHSSLTISDTSISNSNGSGLIVDSCAKVTFLAGLVQFLNNTTPYSGGAIRANNSNITTSDNVQLLFLDNSAKCSGGAVYCSDSISDEVCHTIDNTAVSGHGGANKTVASIVIVNGTTTFKNNSAEKYGGAIFTYNAPLMMVGTGSISFIENKSGTKGGAMCLWSYRTSLSGNITYINNVAKWGGGAIDVEITEDFQLSGIVKFEGNNAGDYGGAIEVVSTTSVSISGDVNFTSNHARLGGALFTLGSWSSNSLWLSANIIFTNNTAYNEGVGGAMMLVNTTFFILNGNATFEENRANIGGAIAAMNVSNMTVALDGTSSKEILFHNNTASNYGGAMYMESTQFELHRNVCFVKNVAEYGGGVYLNEKSHFFFADKVRVVFQENTASYEGGGIFLDSSEHVTTCLPPPKTPHTNNFIRTECTLLWNQDANVTVYFVNNTAGAAGYAWYGGSVDACSNKFSVKTNSSRFDDIVKIEQGLERNTSNISSDPYKLCKCSPNRTECEGSVLNITKFPGQNFTLHVLAFGQRNGTVPTTITASMNFSIPKNDPQNTNAFCSRLKYSVLPQSNETHSVKLKLLPEGNCRALSKGLTVNVEIKDCPTAFRFSSTEGCECAHELKGYTDKCSIDDQTIFRSKDKKFWIGIEENTTALILSHQCPFDYCKPGKIWIPVNDTDEQCNNNRKGLLCGECKPNFSLMLGSSACTEHCSYFYLFLIVPFAVAGLALVVFLFALKLTVAVGTVNGLVFYANTVHIHRTLLFPSKDSFLTVFIAWINLDLGIPTCFYQGMDMYAKTWLQFVFPVYIWVLCGSIIILSSKSYKLSKLLGKNPVAVLSTLFLLSYTKLVKTVIVALFSFTTLNYTNGNYKIVWLYDANVSNAKHAPLIIVSLLMFFLLLPYTVLLFASQWFQQWSNYRLFSWMNSPRVKYFLDTYHAPFKPKHRYWAGLLLIVRVVLQLIVNNVNSPVHSILVLGVIVLSLTMWKSLLGTPYSHSFHSILEVLFFVNLEILAATSLYCNAVQSCDQTAVAQTSAGVAFVVFVIILFYHLYLRLKENGHWPASCSRFAYSKHQTETEETGTSRDQDGYRDMSYSFPS